MSDELEVSFIPMPLISEGYKNEHSFEIKKWKNVKTGFTHFAEGDIGVAKITPCFENKKSVIFNGLQNGLGAGTTELHIIRVFSKAINAKYVLWNLKTNAFIADGINAFSGAVGQKRISKEFIADYLLPIPPIQQQNKIVNVVDDCFLSIDAIENSSNSLDNIKALLKSKVLELAIQGKLVPQDENDEPANVLLERIRTERKAKLGKKYVESYIFKGDDNCYYEKVGSATKNITDEIPFDIPDSWSWARIDEIFQHNTGKALNSSNTKGFLKNYITTSNLYWGHFKLDSLKQMLFTDDEVEKCSIHRGDLLVCEGGDIGRAAIWNYDVPMCIQNHIHKLRAFSYVEIQFYYYVFYLYKQLGIIGGKGIGIQGLSTKALGRIILPVPPLNEQRQILNKISIIFDNMKGEI